MVLGSGGRARAHCHVHPLGWPSPFSQVNSWDAVHCTSGRSATWNNRKKISSLWFHVPWLPEGAWVGFAWVLSEVLLSVAIKCIWKSGPKMHICMACSLASKFENVDKVSWGSLGRLAQLQHFRECCFIMAKKFSGREKEWLQCPSQACWKLLQRNSEMNNLGQERTMHCHHHALVLPRPLLGYEQIGLHRLNSKVQIMN